MRYNRETYKIDLGGNETVGGISTIFVLYNPQKLNGQVLIFRKTYTTDDQGVETTRTFFETSTPRL